MKNPIWQMIMPRFLKSRYSKSQHTSGSFEYTKIQPSLVDFISQISQLSPPTSSPLHVQHPCVFPASVSSPSTHPSHCCPVPFPPKKTDYWLNANVVRFLTCLKPFSSSPWSHTQKNLIMMHCLSWLIFVCYSFSFPSFFRPSRVIFLEKKMMSNCA